MDSHLRDATSDAGDSVARADVVALDAIVADFFAAFCNADGPATTARVYELCLPQAVMIKAVGATPEIYSLREFVEPRIALLRGGELTAFRERELDGVMTIDGNIAQRRSTYEKSGIASGRAFVTRGVKVFQFVRMPDGWKISAVAWDDDPQRSAHA
jgi:ribosomal-protein-serine acetyltransferase